MTTNAPPKTIWRGIATTRPPSKPVTATSSNNATVNTIENFQSEIQQHFQTLRDLASEAPPGDRQELLEQIHQLEKAALQGPSTFVELRNKFCSSLTEKLGNGAAEALIAIPQLLATLGA